VYESARTCYDPVRHRASEARLRALREVETRATRLAALIEDRDARLKEAEDARARAAAAEKLLARTEAKRASLEYHDADFETTRREHDAAAQALHRAELHAVEASGRVEAAEEAKRAAARELRSWRERRALADDLEIELRHHNELDGALSQLRTELNARVRPELGELASRFLADITDGRYTSIEIDESYNVLVMDEGEEKPVISGGEEDVANLVLRLAISQMIAERAGQQLSILILDEVFGSLDIERRDTVIQLLRRLEGRFEQVILITHVETIREGLDNILRVGFDERTGSSIVVEESVAGRIRSPQLVP
jgi:exonuclease SbcC